MRPSAVLLLVITAIPLYVPAGELARFEGDGSERTPIVREIFRNLVTAEGTRAARDRDELLSVFEERDAAAEVLAALIDARLLTSYELPAVEGSENGAQRSSEADARAANSAGSWRGQIPGVRRAGIGDDCLESNQ